MQRNYNAKKRYISDSAVLVDLLSDEGIDVERVEDAGAGQLLAYYKKKNPLGIESHSVHNPFIASLVTSYGRAKLFRVLIIIGDRLIYCDTVVYLRKAPTRIDRYMYVYSRMG